MKRGTIIFNPYGHEVEFEGQHTVLSLAIREGLPLNHSCGGMGTCGTCCIQIESPLENVPPRNEIEKEMAVDRGFSKSERLACQLHAFPRLIVKIP